MIVDLAVDPQIFEANVLGVSGNDIQLVQLVRAIFENVRILVDGGGRLESEYVSLAAALSGLPGRAQHIAIMMTDALIRFRRRRFIPVPTTGDSKQEIIDNVALVGNADAIVTTANSVHSFRTGPVVAIEHYDLSDLEIQRRKFLNPAPPVDRYTRAEFAALLRKIMRWSESIMIIDRNIGQMNNRLYRASLELLVECWLAGQEKSKDLSCSIVVGEKISTKAEDTDAEKINAQKTNRDYVNRIKRDLIGSLERKFPRSRIKFTLKVKVDNAKRILHDRFLVTNTGVYQLSRGFDFLSTPNEMHRQWISPREIDDPHIGECLALADSASMG